jgi:2-oxo-4-hydroxy-4-carboxy-5-ureidoimidazoline decarboxylase
MTTSLEHLNAASRDDFIAALANVFEHSRWIAEAAAAARPFAGVSDMYDAMVQAVRGSAPARRRALVEAHPDLADKTALAAGLTAESSAEQAGAGLDRLSQAEYDAFHRLNAAYRAKFGFPFIICVRRHTKDSILRQFERRLGSDPGTELEAALTEVFRIAALRLDQQVSGPGRLPVHGRLSTHVLDTSRGRPAAGIAIEVIERAAAGESRVIARAVTNADGRTDAPLICGRPVPIGHYELAFSVGAYFAATGTVSDEPPFLDRIPIRFAVAEPEGHYHVPLLVTPWSYATYRGS